MVGRILELIIASCCINSFSDIFLVNSRLWPIRPRIASRIETRYSIVGILSFLPHILAVSYPAASAELTYCTHKQRVFLLCVSCVIFFQSQHFYTVKGSLCFLCPISLNDLLASSGQSSLTVVADLQQAHWKSADRLMQHHLQSLKIIYPKYDSCCTPTASCVQIC